jgi:hypothetical protein
MSIEEAARKICQNTRKDREKARAIYTWLASNISYDWDSINNITESEQEEIGIHNADKTFARRTGVCDGYSTLYVKMANAVNLHAEDLGGFYMTSSYSFGDDVTGEDDGHAWNSVKIGNETILLDATFGASNSQSASSLPGVSDAWFDCDKELFAMTHFPLEINSLGNLRKPYVDVPANQASSKPITRDMFKATPYMTPAFALTGIKGSDLLSFQKAHPNSWAMFQFSGFESVLKDGLKINKFEFSDEIVTGQSAYFNFSFPAGKGVYIYFNEVEIASAQNGKDIELKFDEPGQLIFRYGPEVGTITGFIRYNVVSTKTNQNARENAVRTAFASY